jgi:hypothetical protein
MRLIDGTQATAVVKEIKNICLDQKALKLVL